LVPIKEGEVGIYVCGPTVYNFIHIGNARPLCVFDVLRRYLEYRGYKVTFVQNFTDVDDKIINKANEEGVDAKTISEQYIAEYRTDASGLNVREATVHPKVTENMDAIIKIIEDLIAKGFAYASEGDVYFSTKKFDEYGKLSHQPLEDLVSGARIAVDEIKRDPADFALWKKAKPGEPFWPSPWGEGRPGWHIECSAMSRRFLGETIDIHGGGQDLIFPHHENEIAQSECSSGLPFARYWMHNGYINNDGVKMSKSLGNFFLVRDVAKVYGYEPLRYFLISSHYRSPINYNVEVLDACKSSLTRLYTCRESLDFALKNAAGADDDFTAAKEMVNARREQFCAAMDDDLNTADALAALFELVRDINKEILTGEHAVAEIRFVMESFDELCGVLGILYEKKGADDSLAETVESLIAARAEARKAKNWAEADRIRDELKAMGVVLEDTPQGVKWRVEKA
jgi:cysteinyl-tRNA synthetase